MISKNFFGDPLRRKLRFFFVFVLLLAASIMSSGNAQAVEVGTPFPIATTTGEEVGISAAFDGTNLLVGIQDHSGTAESKITAQLISPPSGTLVGSRISVQRPGWPATGGAPSVAFDGTNYLVIWADDHWSNETYHPDGYDVQFGQLVSKSGTLIGSPFSMGYSYSGSGSVIFDGTNYFVVWEKRRCCIGISCQKESADLADLYGQFITPSGNLLGSVIPVSTAAHGQRDPVLSFDGTNILVVWTDGRNQRACEVVVGGGTRCFESDIYGQLITKSSASAAGNLSGGNVLINASSLPRDSTAPSIAFDGTNYFIVFAEETTLPGNAPDGVETWHIFGQRVTPAGTATGGTISIKTDVNSMFPTVAFDGTKYLVTWTDRINWDVYGQLMSTSGTMIGSEIIIDNAAGNQFGGCGGPAVNGKLFCFINTGFDFSIGRFGDVYGLFLDTSSSLYAAFTNAGIWQWGGSGWTQLTPDNPESMVAAGTNLYGKFGNGIWQWNGSGWTKLTPDRPASMVASGSNLYGNFTGNGIWQWGGSGWTQLTPDNPESMVAADSNLYGKFGNGIWQWTGSGWTKLTPDRPADMVAAGSNLYGSFTGSGIWQWNGSGWSLLTPDIPESMAAAGSNLYGKFGNGIWQWNGSGWTKLTPDKPASMAAAGSNLYGSFTGNGIWQWNGSGWTQLTPDNPALMAVGD
jgi:hypothetical protein